MVLKTITSFIGYVKTIGFLLTESADRSSASELRISTVFVTCLLVARLYC